MAEVAEGMSTPGEKRQAGCRREGAFRRSLRRAALCAGGWAGTEDVPDCRLLREGGAHPWGQDIGFGPCTFAVRHVQGPAC